MSAAAKAPASIIILGHTGFIGEALHTYLRQNTTGEIYGYSSSSIDLECPDSLSTLDNIIGEQTTLILAAAITRDREDTLDSFYTNITMTTNVARFLLTHRINRCIYLSSVAVYGEVNSDLRINENTPIKPASFYAIAKYTGELILRNVANSAGFPLLVLRLCQVYGPGDTHLTYGPSGFTRSIVQNRTLRLYGNGEELRDHLYIDDLVRLVHHFICGNFSGIYNLATGRSYSFQEIVECLQKVAPYGFSVSHAPRTQPFAHQRFDITKLSQAMPDFRFTELTEGLRETYNSFAVATETAQQEGNH